METAIPPPTMPKPTATLTNIFVPAETATFLDAADAANFAFPTVVTAFSEATEEAVELVASAVVVAVVVATDTSEVRPYA